MTRSTLWAASLTLASLLFAPSPVAAKAEYVIKFGTVAPDGTPWAKHLNAIKKRVETQSGGKIKFKLFLGGVLGGEVEMVRYVQRGRLQGWGGSTAALAEGARIPQLQLMELPFLFRSFAEADHILDKVVRKDFERILARKKFVFAQWHENGWRNYATKKKAIRSLKDLQSMKMRSQESPAHLAMYKALGVQAESIPVPEVLGALKTNMVDGFDNTPLFSSATGWYEGIKYYTISQHIYQPAVLVYNKRFIDKLPPKLRKVVIGDEAKETAHGRTSVRSMREQLLKNFRDGGIKVVQMPADVRKTFAARCRKVHKQFEGRIGRALLGKVTKALAKLRKGK